MAQTCQVPNPALHVGSESQVNSAGNRANTRTQHKVTELVSC